MANARKCGLWRGTTAAAASLFAFMLCATSIANVNESAINVQLGTTSYKVEKTGEAGDSTYYKSEFDNVGDLIAEKKKLAEQISEEGSVLFKNLNQALPLDKENEKITLWGLNSSNPTLGGMIGSGTAVDSEHGQVAYGIIEALTERGFEINTTMTDFYALEDNQSYGRKNGHGLTPSFGKLYENTGAYTLGELPPDLYTDSVLDSAKDTTAVIVLSRDSSEAADYNVNMTEKNGDSFTVPLALSEYERAMIELAKSNNNGKVIVLLDTDMTMEIEELKQDPDIDAILWTGLPGIYGFFGVADILSGDVNPSGHISDTYAVSSISAPAMRNFGIYLYTNNSQAGNGAELSEDNKADWYTVENEGIYVGYKYYETRYEDSILGRGNADSETGALDGNAWNYANEITYPFGYGLSYTTFEQTLDSVDVQIDGISTAVVTVTNTGDTAGKDVVQLYVQTPYTEGGLEKAAIQLLDFGKTEILEPGESQTITIEFEPKYMASYDTELVKEDDTVGGWVLEEGDYYFSIGNGAHEALNNVLANKLGSDTDLITITDNEVIRAENAKAVTLERDDTTYSANVQNALQDADINTYIPDTVEYVTRSDWTKGWETIESITPTDELMVYLTNSSTQLTENGDGLTWGADNGLQLINMAQVNEDGVLTALDLSDPQWDQLVNEITLEEAAQFLEQASDEFEVINSIGLNNVFLNDGPIGFVHDQVPGYTAKWNESLSDEVTYIGPDDEYATWAMSEMPTEPVVAATFNKELVEREGELFGEDSLWSNISGIMAPGLNIHRATYCARNHEYYSEDAMLANRMGLAVSIGGSKKGMLVEPKHFAFNHQEWNRSGLSTFVSEQGGRENELRAFQGALETNYAKGLMTAFNRIGGLYSGAHSGILKQILRNEWGYTGFIVTDMINGADYMNWRDAVFGGGGAILGNQNTYKETQIGSMTSAENLKLIEKDTAFQQEMHDALKYYVYTFASSNAMNGVSNDTRIVHVATWWQNVLTGADAALGVLTALFAVLYLWSVLKEKKTSKEVQS